MESIKIERDIKNLKEELKALKKAFTSLIILLFPNEINNIIKEEKEEKKEELKEFLGIKLIEV